MKKATCSAIGGPADCTVEFMATSAEEMIDQAWAHMQEVHPDLAKKIMANSKEENDKWMADFKTKFNALPNA